MARILGHFLAKARSRLAEYASPLVALSQAYEEPMRVEHAVEWSALKVAEPLSQSKMLQPEATWERFGC